MFSITTLITVHAQTSPWTQTSCPFDLWGSQKDHSFKLLRKGGSGYESPLILLLEESILYPDSHPIFLSFFYHYDNEEQFLTDTWDPRSHSKWLVQPQLCHLHLSIFPPYFYSTYLISVVYILKITSQQQRLGLCFNKALTWPLRHNCIKLTPSPEMKQIFLYVKWVLNVVPSTTSIPHHTDPGGNKTMLRAETQTEHIPNCWPPEV